MPTSIYKINKGINRSIEFRGLKAQYIWWLAGGIICLLIVFAILYITGVNAFVCVAFILVAGTALFIWIYKVSDRFGEFGMMKKMAKRNIPKTVKCNSRRFFICNEI